MIIEGLGNSDEPFHRNDQHPHHRHSYGDALDRVCHIWDNSEEPFSAPDLVNNDLINEEHDDQEAVNNGKNYEVMMKMAQN